VKVPLLIAGEQSSTTVQPMSGLIDALRETEKQDGILACSYLMGFPWCDNEDSSAAVYVTADTQALADREALRLAELMWSKLFPDGDAPPAAGSGRCFPGCGGGKAGLPLRLRR
jgi:microcystin degradation protein MlrC